MTPTTTLNNSNLKGLINSFRKIRWIKKIMIVSLINFYTFDI